MIQTRKSISAMEPQLVAQAQEREGRRDPPFTLPSDFRNFVEVQEQSISETTINA